MSEDFSPEKNNKSNTLRKYTKTVSLRISQEVNFYCHFNLSFFYTIDN